MAKLRNVTLEEAKKAITKWKEKKEADKEQADKSIDALQKRIQTKNVKRLMTTGGAYKKRAPVKVIDTKSSGSTYKFYAGGGKAIKGLGRAFQKGGKV
jgi:hypothetical protein